MFGGLAYNLYRFGNIVCKFVCKDSRKSEHRLNVEVHTILVLTVWHSH